MLTILYIIIACIFSAILYRAGGQDKNLDSRPKWMPKWLRFNQARDIFCPLVFIGLSMLLFGISKNWLGYLLCFVTSWIALSTYWDEIFGYDNFFVHGLGCGFSGLFLVLCGVSWWILIARLIICSFGMGIWSGLVDKDYLEEMGRGIFFIL